MAYRDFEYPRVIGQLGLTEQPAWNLFGRVPPVAPREHLTLALVGGQQLAAGEATGLARKVWLVGPVLQDLWGRYRGSVSLNADVEVNADPAAGLDGFCDITIGVGPQRHVASAPSIVLAVSGSNDVTRAFGPCIAGMVGAQRFNQKRGRPVDTSYGCVTTGSLWRFGELTGTTLTLDMTEYTLSQVDRLLGILVHMIGPVPGAAAA